MQSIVRRLGKVVLSKELMTNKLTVVFTRPFTDVAFKPKNLGKSKPEVRKEAVEKTWMFDSKAPGVFDGMSATIFSLFHPSKTDSHDHISVKVELKGAMTYWYQKSEHDYWDTLHVWREESLMRPDDWARITKEMMDVGRKYRKPAGQVIADTYWYNTVTKEVVEWKKESVPIPTSLYGPKCDEWHPISHEEFNT